MIVKRYVVREMPEALSQIRRDLGKDAIILSTKKIRSKGILGLFGKSEFEVIAAAMQEEADERLSTPPLARVQSSSAPPKSAAVATKEEDRKEWKQRSSSQENPNHEEKNGGQVLQEVQQLRSLVQTFLMSQPQMFPPSVQKVQQRLLHNGVKEELVLSLLHGVIQDIGDIERVSEEELSRRLCRQIAEEARQTGSPLPIAEHTRVISLVGPTGVGKTTTLAKLAAMQVLKEEKKVALLTTDTYRIAAVEQLKTYADILNVPLAIVYTQEEGREALRAFGDKERILLDTAGRNYTQRMHVAELNSFLQVLQPDEIYLVLSLTTKQEDLERIIESFKTIPIHKLLFTKLDETSTYGVMYNLVKKYQIPFSYVGTGQNVPDDMELLTPENFAKLVMGEKRYA